jgi:hypothetical protein
MTRRADHSADPDVDFQIDAVLCEGGKFVMFYRYDGGAVSTATLSLPMRIDPRAFLTNEWAMMAMVAGLRWHAE